jgi:2'-5' RNA ligase/GNAT superfamily N-acetyltransferase
VRLAVALVMPRPVASEIDGMRRAFGVDPAYIPPHITLVPPVNVDSAQMGEVLSGLRDAGDAAGAPLFLDLGPLDTFLPSNPVLFLRVGGELDRLGELRRRCLSGRLDRPDPRPFVPHVTITRGLSSDDDATARRMLGGFRTQVELDRLHLLVQVTTDVQGRHWTPTADVLLAPRHTVGTGGLEVELTTTQIADPEIRSLVRSFGSGLLPIAGGSDAFVVAARHEGRPVGAAWGTVSGRVALVVGAIVVPDWRRRGVGAHLVATLEHHASRRGASAIEAPVGLDEPADALFESRGWTLRAGPGGQRRWRALGPDPGAQPNSMEA